MSHDSHWHAVTDLVGKGQEEACGHEEQGEGGSSQWARTPEHCNILLNCGIVGISLHL